MTEDNNEDEEQQTEIPEDFDRVIETIEDSDELGSYSIVCRGYDGDIWRSANWTHGGAYHLVAALEVLRRSILRRQPGGYNRLETLSQDEHLVERMDELHDVVWGELEALSEEIDEIKEDIDNAS